MFALILIRFGVTNYELFIYLCDRFAALINRVEYQKKESNKNKNLNKIKSTWSLFYHSTTPWAPSANTPRGRYISSNSRKFFSASPDLLGKFMRSLRRRWTLPTSTILILWTVGNWHNRRSVWEAFRVKGSFRLLGGCWNKKISYFTKTMVCENIAAAVFEHGRLEQSPSAHTLGYLLCLSVYLSTSTYPPSLVNPDSLRKGAGVIGGTKWRKS